MDETVNKKDVELLLGFEITEKQFREALECAGKKRDYIYETEHRSAILQHWYLVKLTEEYVRSLILSELTVDLCMTLRDMEKEHLFNELGAPTDDHIVAVPAL